MQFAVCGLAVLLITGCAAVEQFSNGFTFQRAAMMNTEALDDAGEKLFEDKCLELIYGDGTHTIAIGLETSELAEKIVHKSFAKQHRVRRYEIVYGAERQYMKSTHRIVWEMDGVIYCIASPYMDKYDEADLWQMAEEIITK